jgi:hypothetical protein
VVVTLDKWELDLRIVELFDVVTTSLGSDDLLDLDDLMEGNGKTCKHRQWSVALWFLTWIEWARARWREAMSL